jgi:polar amino acid transport system permease protein
MLRLGWPAYTNEAIFLFHATTLVFFRAFRPSGRWAMRCITPTTFADKTFNPFVPYPIVAFYFILLTLIVTWGFSAG